MQTGFLIQAILAFGLPLLIVSLLIVAKLTDKRKTINLRCPVCDYALTGNTSGVCPECGTPIPKEVQDKLAADPTKGQIRQHGE